MVKKPLQLPKSICCGARSGRPALLTREQRETLILDALEQTIAERGLQGASMSAIAKTAGMSKRTLYTIFDNRDAMFESWVRHVRASFMRPLEPEERDLPLENRLRRLLRPEVRHCSSDTRLAVLRAVIAEAHRHPDLARTFHREGVAETRRLLQGELERAVSLGELELTLEECASAATLLMDMVHGSLIDKLVLPDQPGLEEREEAMEARLKLTVRIFLEGARPRTAKAAQTAAE